MDQDHEHVLTLLQSLKNASKDLHNNLTFLSNTSSYDTIRPFLNLNLKTDSVFSTNPNLFKLSKLLSNLSTLLEKLEKNQGYGIKSLIRHQITKYKISQLAYAIEGETQAYLDRECIQNLVNTLEESDTDEEEKVRVLIEFINRVSRGFDGDFQESILKAKVFSILELLLWDDDKCSKGVREHVALAIAALASFNRNVFVGLVLMGPTIQALIFMDSCISIQVLCSLINLIQNHLIDEIHSRKEIPRIIGFLNSKDLCIQVAGIDCICQIAYFGRREIIEAMIEEGLINKLMELQRWKLEDDSIIKSDDTEEDVNSETRMEIEEGRIVKNSAFSNCVARFAVQVEVGEGLDPKEKKEVKLEILKKVREASVSEAETATIVSDLLWGSSSY